jgi:hypothetical protein
MKTHFAKGTRYPELDSEKEIDLDNEALPHIS